MFRQRQNLSFLMGTDTEFLYFRIRCLSPELPPLLVRYVWKNAPPFFNDLSF